MNNSTKNKNQEHHAFALQASATAMELLSREILAKATQGSTEDKKSVLDHLTRLCDAGAVAYAYARLSIEAKTKEMAEGLDEAKRKKAREEAEDEGGSDQ